MSVSGNIEERASSLRAARTAALARRGATAEAARATHPYLVCACGVERYGLPLSAAAAILPMRACTPVPGAVPALIGLAALSGSIVSVIGLAAALGRAGERAENGHLVTLRPGAVPCGFPVALAVDRVLGLAHRAEASPHEAGPDVDGPDVGGSKVGGLGDAMVSGYAPADPDGAATEDFVVIDLARLLRRTLP